MIDLPMMQQESSRTITRNDLMVSSSPSGDHATHICRLIYIHIYIQLFLLSRHNWRFQAESYIWRVFSFSLFFSFSLSINFHYTIAIDDVYLLLSCTIRARTQMCVYSSSSSLRLIFLSFQKTRIVMTLSRR